jgi:hypothetical protein
MTDSPRTIVAEFHKSAGKRLTLWSLTVLERGEDGGREYISRTYYDVNWSRSYGYLFHQSGAGGGDDVEVGGIYFVSGDVTIKEMPCQLVDARDKPPWRGRRTRVIRARNRTRRMRALPKAFDIKPGHDLLDWLQWNAIQQEAVYCSICRDDLPGDQLCAHTWWCDEIGWYSTPSEPCGCAPGADCHSR